MVVGDFVSHNNTYSSYSSILTVWWWFLMEKVEIFRRHSPTDLPRRLTYKIKKCNTGSPAEHLDGVG